MDVREDDAERLRHPSSGVINRWPKPPQVISNYKTAGDRGMVDTAAPICSVKDAVSKFNGGGSGWKSRKSLNPEQWNPDGESEIEKVRKEVAEVRRRSEAAQQAKEAVLKDLAVNVGLVSELERELSLAKETESIDNGKHLEDDLVMEFSMLKKLLEASRALHLEAEERRIDTALEFDRDKARWGEELREAEAELRRLENEVSSARDLESQLESAYSLLTSLRAELLTAEALPPLSEIERELAKAKVTIEKAKDEMNCLRIAAISLKSDLEREEEARIALSQSESLAAVTVSSHEIEISSVDAEMESILRREREVDDGMADLPKQLQLASEEARRAKAAHQSARDDLAKAEAAAERSEAEADALNKRLGAVEKEIYAAKESERLALAAVEALGSDHKEGSVWLTLEEYKALSVRARQVEDCADRTVNSALEQITAIKDSVQRSRQNLAQVTFNINELKRSIGAVAETAEKEQTMVVPYTAPSSSMTVVGFPATPPGARRRRRSSLFPRIIMFLGKMKAHQTLK